VKGPTECTAAYGAVVGAVGPRRGDDGEAAGTAHVSAFITSVTVRGSWRAVAARVGDGFGAGFHFLAPGGFIGVGAAGGAASLSGGCNAVVGGLTFEFAEDCFFVFKQIANETECVAIFEGQGVFCTGSEDTRREDVRKV
jgi:hypothetical protein